MMEDTDFGGLGRDLDRAKKRKESEKENEKWDRRFLALAQHISSWSKDPSTKCGAVLVRPNRTIASLGYNGFPRGINDAPEVYANREAKYARVVHAEMNAILNCAERPQGFTLYTFSQGWGPCCAGCATCIIQAGIARVVYDIAPVPERAEASVGTAIKLLSEANIPVLGYEP